MEVRLDPDSAPGRSDTERAVALAHLLHQDCKTLLQLYQERESFLTHHVPDGERLLTFTLCTGGVSTTAQVSHAHSALQQCREMLECVISREVEDMGEELEGEYEAARKTVKDRIGHLLYTTGVLLGDAPGGCPPTPEFQCAQGLDEVEGSGSFGAKLWTYRLLLELIHWSDTAARALHLLHSESWSPPEEGV